MAKRGRRAAREGEMRAALERWQRSDLTLSRFAEREGIGRKALYRWRLRLGIGGRRLRPGRPAGPGRRVERAEAPTMFTEVNRGLRTAALSAMSFEVEFRDGTTVRVPSGFDARALRTLLETLGQC